SRCRSGGDGGRRVCRRAASRGLSRSALVTVRQATAFAPALVGNVAIGFDILGFSVDALGDRVTVSRRAEPGVSIRAVRGVAGDLPKEPEKNTAGRALLAMQDALKPGFGFEMEIDKGIPLGSG